MLRRLVRILASFGLFRHLESDLIELTPSAGSSLAQVVAEVLIQEVREQAGGLAGLETYHRAYGASPAMRSGLLRMWSELEDRIGRRVRATTCLGVSPGQALVRRAHWI